MFALVAVGVRFGSPYDELQRALEYVIYVYGVVAGPSTPVLSCSHVTLRPEAIVSGRSTPTIAQEMAVAELIRAMWSAAELGAAAPSADGPGLGSLVLPSRVMRDDAWRR